MVSQTGGEIEVEGVGIAGKVDVRLWWGLAVGPCKARAGKGEILRWPTTGGKESGFGRLGVPVPT